MPPPTTKPLAFSYTGILLQIPGQQPPVASTNAEVLALPVPAAQAAAHVAPIHAAVAVAPVLTAAMPSMLPVAANTPTAASPSTGETIPPAGHLPAARGRTRSLSAANNNGAANLSTNLFAPQHSLACPIAPSSCRHRQFIAACTRMAILFRPFLQHIYTQSTWPNKHTVFAPCTSPRSHQNTSYVVQTHILYPSASTPTPPTDAGNMLGAHNLVAASAAPAAGAT